MTVATITTVMGNRNGTLSHQFMTILQTTDTKFPLLAQLETHSAGEQQCHICIRKKQNKKNRTPHINALQLSSLIKDTNYY